MTRLIIVIILSLASLYFAFPWYAYDISTPANNLPYKLGLDLQGGVELDYKVDLAEVSKEAWYNNQREQSIIEGLKSIIEKRVQALNINDSTISSANYGGEQHIIVQIPLKGDSKEADQLNIKRAKDAIGRVMKIEFKELRGSITEADLKARQEIAQSLLKEAQESKYQFSVTSNKYRDTYEKVSIGDFTGSIESLKVGLGFTGSELATGIYPKVLSGTGFLTLLSNSGSVVDGYGIVSVDSLKDATYTVSYALVAKEPSEWKPAQDSKGRVLNDKYFLNSSVQVNEAFQPMIELTFNTDGAQIFGELTSRLKGHPIAIFVGGELLTAPTVNEAILSGKAVITGNYTSAQAKKLSNDINTWVVPAPIYLTSERSIDSRLGLNSLHQLIVAGIAGFILIFLFLVTIYRWSGFVSAIALFIYTLVVLCIVKALSLVLTLASIAGLILSIGMAIDANILIFERIKDGLRNKSPTEKSVQDGFANSWSAIWDSNLTGIIISIILYVFGVNMIKGFGLMLGIWLVISLLSAMFISRLFIVLLIHKKKKLSNVALLGIKD